VAESYVHRIGRTARAGATGAAITFCDVAERPSLHDIQREIRMEIPVVEDHPYRSQHARLPPRAPAVPVALPPLMGYGTWRPRGPGGRRRR
jgi:ATP-dependent RNA helicase RhlE